MPSALIATMLSVMLLGVPTGIAAAQVTTTVLGTVTDSEGGVLPGATVVLISETRGTPSPPVTTNATGDFVLPSVIPDTYTLQIEMPSFKTLKRTGLQVGAEPRVIVGTLILELGNKTEIVNVIANALTIQSASGERSFTVDAASVEHLPIANRNYTNLAGLAPGVDGTTRVGGGGDTNITMDGVSTSSPGNNAIMLRLNPESVAEVRGDHVRLPGRVRPCERPPDLVGDQGRDESVPRIGVRRRAKLGLEQQQPDE